MANLKEIRSRISSVGSTMQITSAMKMVSAAKLKRAQDAVTQMRPYSNKLTELLVNLSSTLDSSEGGVYSENRDPKKILLVTITSNRGLCGGFNANIIKKAKYLMEADYKNIETDILSIGKKSTEHFEKNGYNVISSHDGLYSDLTFENTSEIAQIIMDSFTNKDYDKIILLYNQFKNAATQIVMNEQFLPIKSPEETETKVGDYIFEPNQKDIVDQLIPKSLKTQLFKSVLDSHASEHGARMTAMHKATDNAGEIKKELTLQYNKARQAAITGEILEIVGGAEALNG
ncbi:MAG: ATP synthase F1 subunit gamma [Flavobacteriales bacterium]|jgi:F-type H+-transporting ATPase subunit gamma|nr:ATP synthase F1 subunit gamma [Flavobacteriales bacterium]MBT5698704.1 ATP synthase F1 subunit gamma [Flavobacteriales bacterium]MBT7620094.1 ATP synthase F1 subunit gamma [Flavobacteriales bacterium]MBT7727069.1 ATP synthase F1 subunit gamma [Flavobacteriales bacterium]MDG2059050.1 ATP synthase F1 subunit gamma [Flavobacteriales bacterium]